MMTQSLLRWLLLSVCLALCCFSEADRAGTGEAPAFPQPAPDPGQNACGAHLQRTMTLLATSTPRHRNRVRILFYGQSITKQDWSKAVTEDLRRRFPNADLIVENRAIGGFASNLLIRTEQRDVTTFYPDLILFHDYGGEPDYEAIIADIRQRTTAEIGLQTDHITWLPKDPQTDDPQALHTYNWHEKHNSVWLPGIADRYGCELIDIRTPWKRYLQDNHLQPADLLIDGVHLNAQGNFLMAALVGRCLRYDRRFARQEGQPLTHTYAVGHDVHWKNGVLTLQFEGNRVDLIAAEGPRSGGARIKIDGRSPSEFPELYQVTRTNDIAGKDWPWQTGGIIHLSWNRPLMLEEWTLRIKEVNADASRFSFDVSGSRTGPDGSGNSAEKFVSNSGRVVIEPGDWWVKDVQSKPLIAPGTEITWRVLPMFTDTYEPAVAADAAQEEAVTVAQGLSNGAHTLEIDAQGDSPPIRSIRVYRPPVASQRP